MRPNKEGARQIMELSFGLRRRWDIFDHAQPVSALLEKFPFLQTKDEVIYIITECVTPWFLF